MKKTDKKVRIAQIITELKKIYPLADAIEKEIFLQYIFQKQWQAVKTYANEKGIRIIGDLPIYVEEINVRALAVELREYLVYVEQGEDINFEEYITSVSANFVEIENYDMLVSTNFDCNTPGTYSVHFNVEDSAGRTGHSVLTVVVRGEAI